MVIFFNFVLNIDIEFSSAIKSDKSITVCVGGVSGGVCDGVIGGVCGGVFGGVGGVVTHPDIFHFIFRKSSDSFVSSSR